MRETWIMVLGAAVTTLVVTAIAPWAAHNYVTVTILLGLGLWRIRIETRPGYEPPRYRPS